MTFNRANYSSLQDTINAIPDGTHGVVYIPAGTWLEIQRAIVPPSKNVTFMGDGMDRSVLSWTVPGGGILVNMGSYERTSVIRDLTLETQVASGGAALEINGVPAGSSPFKTAQITGISVRPNGINTGNYWEYGIILRHAWNVHIEGFLFQGYNEHVYSQAGIYLGDQCVNAHVIGYHAYSVRNAIELQEDAVSEGLNITAGKWVYVETGLLARTLGANGGLTVVGVHMDVLLAGIRMNYRHLGEIIGVTIQKNPASQNNFLGIEIQNSDWCRIQASNIQRAEESADQSDNGIILNNSSYSNISGNQIRGFDSGIWIKSGNRNMITNNIGHHNGTMIVDQGFQSTIYQTNPNWD
ncbi:MAG: right-handed parallel beta-helix repeat-containing protein [Niastella sp.]|uniref:right-handed parallel beta-helix repeat-containing protein n=1 Tax=Niastella sp. TaxID=1869183 RepID=UPI00389A5715